MNTPQSNGLYDIISAFNYGTALGNRAEENLRYLEQDLGLAIQTINAFEDPGFVRKHDAYGTPLYLFFNNETGEIKRVIGFQPIEELTKLATKYCS